ncbi:DUF6896 domain-containing protein [Spongiimicrobium salis]|uniref:DUF6896 domain-containing protein n=1 Tax=Spongiimicrobium salis TaxID=1667022 RepID=UPI00374D0B31
MFSFLKHRKTKNTLLKWSNTVDTFIHANEVLQSKIDQSGILEGEEIISEFLENREFALAYEHLVYMIQESGIYLPDSLLHDISEFATKVGCTPPELSLPTVLETNEFYEILTLFRQVQDKVVSQLTRVWQMSFPIKADEWTVWSQTTYEKTAFANTQGITIFPHGYGLHYHDSENTIDFDFGEFGEAHGFTANRLWTFIQTNKVKTLFTHETQIKKVVTHLTEKGELKFSGYMNYYKTSKCV